MSVRSLRYNSLMLGQAKYSAASTDRDAAAFLEAAGIYATHEQKAIYELVRLLKQYGLWSKMKAVYPFVGGTATTHKWNLKDPRDLDAAFRLTFNGGWTHSNTGADPNGTNGYAITYITPSLHLQNASTHGAIYNRQNDGIQRGDYGAFVSAAADFALIAGNWTVVNKEFYSDCWNAGTNRFSAQNDNTSGFYVQTRTSATVHKLLRNNVQLGATNTNTASGHANVNINIWLSTVNTNNAPNTFSPRELAYASFGDGLDDTEAANLYWAVDKYQRLLSRNV